MTAVRKLRADRVEAVENRLAKAIQKVRDEIGATEHQRVAFAYAEAAMRAEFTAMRLDAPQGSEDER